MRKSLKVILTMVITIMVVGYSDMLSVDAETVAPTQTEIKEAMDSAPSVYLSVNEYGPRCNPVSNVYTKWTT